MDTASWMLLDAVGCRCADHGGAGADRADRADWDRAGDLRAAIIHGARAVLRWADRHEHVQSQWLLRLKDRRGAQKTIVAFANTTHRDVGSAATRLERVRQMARIAWAVITSDGRYDRTKAFKAQPARSAAAVEAAAVEAAAVEAAAVEAAAVEAAAEAAPA